MKFTIISWIPTMFLIFLKQEKSKVFSFCTTRCHHRHRHRYAISKLSLATDSQSLKRQNNLHSSAGSSSNTNFLQNAATAASNAVNSSGKETNGQVKNGFFGSSSPPPQRLQSSNNDNIYMPKINLSLEEEELFILLKQVASAYAPNTTLRVAGGWVRDKILATPEFNARSSSTTQRLTSKYSSKGRGNSVILNNSVTQQQQPLDIDIALDDMLGRHFAEFINTWLCTHGKDSISYGVVMSNPDKSKHLETATMKLGQFWIDLVNLRAEEYVSNSRIPDLMRIGTPEEDAYRRDLTINALFYNINENTIEDLTDRGITDLQKGIIATPLRPLTTLLDDPLRILRSIRFAARLRFTMDNKLRIAAKDERVRWALSQKVSRERIGGELDLMLRSPDPVGAVRLLINLDLISTVIPTNATNLSTQQQLELNGCYGQGLALLSTTHDYLLQCSITPPHWCQKKIVTESSSLYGVTDGTLMEDEDARRTLWYASFLKPLHNYYDAFYSRTEKKKVRPHGKKSHRSIIMHTVIDQLKRSARDAENIEKIIRASNEFSECLSNSLDNSMTMAVLLHGIKIQKKSYKSDDGTTIETVECSKNSDNGRLIVHSDMVQDPIWTRCMDYRLKLSNIMEKVGPLWRAALILSLSEQLSSLNHGDEFDVAIEGDVIEQSHEEIRQGIIDTYDAFAVSLMQLGLVGIWSERPLLNGVQVKSILQNIPKGPIFRHIMDDQIKWMRLHPGGNKDVLIKYLKDCYPDFA